MTIEFRDAKRQDIRLLILLAGGTGAGKTESAMRLATGLAGGQSFAVIDTENGRALHKADDYSFKHAPLDEPFSPERYAETVKAAEEAGFPVIVIDSGSHEYEGVGGVLDMQTEEFARLGGRDTARMSSWIEPKRRHKRFVQTLLRSPAHIIMCLRSEDKIEVVKDEQGKTVVRPRQSLTGAEGWIPICEKRLPFEATISLLVLQANPGVPVPIKLERRHQELVPLTEQLSEETGKRLAEWARGSKTSPTREASVKVGGSEEATPDAQLEGVGSSPDPPSPAPSAEPADLRRLAAGDVTIPAGANKGKAISELTEAQLKWALEHPDSASVGLEVHAAIETYLGVIGAPS